VKTRRIFRTVVVAILVVAVAAPAGAAQLIAPRTCGAGWTVAPQPAPLGSGGLDAVSGSPATGV